ncbi:MAG: hypothetical protein HYZ38_05050 [Mycobacterium sp.]|nr:hypothetical protein [Mycobacterium sp.]
MSPTESQVNDAEVIELTAEQGAALFDQTARAYMKMSGPEFLELWNAGKFDDTDWDDIPGLAEVAIALPFALR